MNIRRWHWGKIVIVWAWGGAAAAMMLNDFMSSGKARGLLGTFVPLLALSWLTWLWLGGKEEE